MNDLRQLVHEALERRREERSGCFVHNVAAVELLEHGAEAVAAIENEVLALATRDGPTVPRDLASVMVIYGQLVKRLDDGDRCMPFLNRLPHSFLRGTLECVCGAWRNPVLSVLPRSLRSYVEGIAATGMESERREAKRVLNWFTNDRNA
jgi:hypothetical protein